MVTVRVKKLRDQTTPDLSGNKRISCQDHTISSTNYTRMGTPIPIAINYTTNLLERLPICRLAPPLTSLILILSFLIRLHQWKLPQRTLKPPPLPIRCIRRNCLEAAISLQKTYGRMPRSLYRMRLSVMSMVTRSGIARGALDTKALSAIAEYTCELAIVSTCVNLRFYNRLPLNQVLFLLLLRLSRNSRRLRQT